MQVLSSVLIEFLFSLLAPSGLVNEKGNYHRKQNQSADQDDVHVHRDQMCIRDHFFFLISSAVNRSAAGIPGGGSAMKTGLILLGLMAIQPNGMSDVVKLLAADFLESLAAIGELLIDFDDFFRHLLVRILRSPYQRKVRSRSDPLVTI
jgi:hypothetical protein